MATAAVVHHLALPKLLDTLKQQFSLVPNYDRPLDGRLVGDMTDWEIAGCRLWPGATKEQAIDLGKRVRQVWYFRVDGVRLRFNDYYEQHPHFGIQHAALCRDCRAEVWAHANRKAPTRCRACHLAQFEATPRCPDTGLACSTAYRSKTDPCRCEACRAWYAAKHRRLRASRNPLVSSASSSGVPSLLLLRRTKHGVTQPWHPKTWAWLPTAVRAVLVLYARAAWAEYDEMEAAA